MSPKTYFREVMGHRLSKVKLLKACMLLSSASENGSTFCTAYIASQFMGCAF